MISIIIPIFNAENYLKRMLESILGQSYQKFECILIDDGSSDSSYSICKEYEEKDTRMRCFTQKNHGVSYTRNKGISLARGKFIAFLDADDFIPPNYLYELVKCCEIGDVAICDTVFLDEKAVKFRFTVGKTVLTRTDAINALLIRKSINSGPAGKLYKKEFSGRSPGDCCRKTLFCGKRRSNACLYHSRAGRFCQRKPFDKNRQHVCEGCN